MFSSKKKKNQSKNTGETRALDPFSHEMDGKTFEMNTFNLHEKSAISEMLYCFKSEALLIATNMNTSEIQAWKIDEEIEQFKIAYTLKGHKAIITALCLSEQTNTLFSGSHDKQLIIWNLKNCMGKLIYRMTQKIETESSGILCLTLNEKDRTVFAGTGDSKVFVYQRDQSSDQYSQKQVIRGSSSIPHMDDLGDIRNEITSLEYSPMNEILYISAREDCFFLYRKMSDTDKSEYVFKRRNYIKSSDMTFVTKTLFIQSQDIVVCSTVLSEIIFFKNKNSEDKFKTRYDGLESPLYSEIGNIRDNDNFISSLAFSESLGGAIFVGKDDGTIQWYKVRMADMEGDDMGEEDEDEEVFDNKEASNETDSIKRGGAVDKRPHSGGIIAMFYCDRSNQLFSACDNQTVRVRQFKGVFSTKRRIRNQEEIPEDDQMGTISEQMSQNIKNREDIKKKNNIFGKVQKQESFKSQKSREKVENKVNTKVRNNSRNNIENKQVNQYPNEFKIDTNLNKKDEISTLQSNLNLILDNQERIIENIEELTQDIATFTKNQKENTESVHSHLKNQSQEYLKHSKLQLDDFEKRVMEQPGEDRSQRLPYESASKQVEGTQQQSELGNGANNYLEEQFQTQGEVNSIWVKDIRQEIQDLKSSSDKQYWELFRFIERFDQKQNQQHEQTSKQIIQLMKCMGTLLQ